jgi:hypothetical protein
MMRISIIMRLVLRPWVLPIWCLWYGYIPLDTIEDSGILVDWWVVSAVGICHVARMDFWDWHSKKCVRANLKAS